MTDSTYSRPLWKPGTMIYPLPAVLVTCGDSERSNIITVSWTGILCTDPAMCYISVRPERCSHDIIADRGEFTICLTTEAMARATDLCGVTSGRDHDKWAEAGLTPVPGVKVACPYIKESPLALECRVKEMVHLGSHDMFVADILDTLPDPAYINPDTGVFHLDDTGLIAYTHGHYNALGRELGHFGWSIRKK